MASSVATRASGIPTSSTTTIRSSRRRRAEEGYHLTEDLADRAIQFISDAKQVDPDKPFYLHFCTGATHAPHHVPKEWADRYKGVFDDGWDAYREKVFARQKELGIIPQDAELSRHDPDVPEWESLSDDQRRLYARMMEVFAGFLSHTDHHIGRLLDHLESIGELENTLIMVISDNGASAEGGPTGTTNEAQFFNNAQEPFEDSLAAIDEIGGPKYFNHYPWGWTFAGNTPFRRWKRETYRGGTSDPFIVSWPKRITANGEVREQYAHIIDMVPTVLDVLGIEPPATIRGVSQSPLHGMSFAHTFDDAAAASRRTTQYFEMLGHRSIYHDGWRAVCPWPGPSFAEAGKGFGEPISAETLAQLDAQGWELYHVAEDPAENHDLADEHRDRLIALIATWYVEAGKYDVMPVDGSGLARMASEKPLIAAPRDSFVYYPDTQSVPFFAGRAGAQPPAQHHRRRGDPRGRGRGRAALPGHLRGRLHALRQGPPAALHAQLGGTRAAACRVRRGADARAGTSCASSSSRPDSPTPPRATGARAASSSTSTASSSATARSRTRRRSCSTPGR